jgi:hypothetical protein
VGSVHAPQAVARVPRLSVVAGGGPRVLGAGLPRTGTTSLQAALSQLLGGPTYHMHEVFDHLEHVPVWREALAGRPPEWRSFFADYVAAVDWPASAFWRELTAAFPDAPVVLSVRADASTWWESAQATVLPTAWKEQPPELADWRLMLNTILNDRFTPHWRDPEAAMAAYEAHNAAVREAVPASRLLEWRASDGWEPLCNLLSVPIPDEPFPHLNTRSEW